VFTLKDVLEFVTSKHHCEATDSIY
jgi:hypothetical protein